MSAVIGLDVGTTGTKGVLIDDGLEIVARSYKGYEFVGNNGSFVEQDAEDWWEAVVHVVRECVKDYQHKSEIHGICVSSQGATLVCSNEKGKALAPACVWMDCRADRQGEWVNEHLGEDFTYRKTGWRATNRFNLLQIMWIRDNKKELYQQAHKFLSTNEYINFRLSGKFVGDPTNAAMSQLFDIVEKKWDDDLMAACGIDESKLASIVDVGDPIGPISEETREELGLPNNVMVYNGGHDQYLAAVGSGAVNIGDVLLSCGTSWGVTEIVDAPYFNTDLYYSPGRHAVDGLWGLFAYTPAGGAALEWYRQNIALRGADGELIGFEDLDRSVLQSPTGARGLTFMPHFAGTSCPTWSKNSRATLLGLEIGHDRSDIARAVMEGVGYEVHWILESLRRGELKPNCIKSLGGATKSRVWMQIVSNITGLVISNPVYADTPVLGAAIIAGMRCALVDSVTQACAKLNQVSSVTEPDMATHREYIDLFDQYKQSFEFVRKGYTELLTEETQM